MNQKRSIIDMVDSQVIAAVKDPTLIEEAAHSACNLVFLMTGDLLSMGEYISRLRERGKTVFIHADFIQGISGDKKAIQYMAREWRPDGIITTRNQTVRVAKEQGLITIQRLFVIDQSAIEKGMEMVRSSQPDAVEVMPGILPRVIDEITGLTPLPLIAGGLMKNKQEITEALKAGALATSVGSPQLWNTGL